MDRFSLKAVEAQARLGAFVTKHGVFDTPNFMPVGTRGSVRGVDTERLQEVGAQIALVNTYHLWIRPGADLVRRLGGIHAFMAWSGPILSDSGGFQVFSLKTPKKVSAAGVEFSSHLDGSKLFLTPEKAIALQEELGVDIAMVLDECPPGDWTEDTVAKSLDRTIAWEKRCLAARRNPDMCVFAITQGGRYANLRKTSAQALCELPFDGYAIGGLSVGEPKDHMYEVLSYHPAQLPSTHIRYLMGVGTPQDIVQAVKCGVDLFDCVMPTRAGRFGRAFVSGEKPFINVRNSQYQSLNEPLDQNCGCLACRHYSLGYIHHLFHCEEMLGPQLVSIHNLRHYLSLMERIRAAIAGSTFEDLYRAESARWVDVEKVENDEIDAD